MFCKKLEEVASNHLASFAGGSGYEFEADAKPFKNLSQGPSCQQYTQCHYGFFAEEKKPNPTLALHKSFFSVYEGTGFITNPEGTGFTTNSFTSNNPLGEGTSSIPGPNPQLSNTLPVTKPAYTMSAPKELGLCKPTLFHGDRKQISTFIQECKVYLLVNRAVYMTDEVKIAFILSYMNDKEVKKWKDTYLCSITDKITEDINFPTYALFIALLKKHFKAYDRKRQGKGSINSTRSNREIDRLKN